jgi:hypothetical protein
VTEQHAPLIVSSRTVTLRAARELHLLMERMHSIEAALAHLLEGKELGLCGNTVQALQQMDMISQTVLALADYLEQIAPEMCRDDRVDAQSPLARVPLKAMADRLSGNVGHEALKSDPILF